MANANDGKFNFKTGFTCDFDLRSGLSQSAESTKRYLSQMRGMYRDDAAFDAMVKEGDPVVYEFYEMSAPEDAGELAFGTSITYPGKVGDEYFMTKGHFHTVLETAEVYYCLSGSGCMLIENPEGDWALKELRPGSVVYVPERYAHRTVNTGDAPLVTFFVFRADAGHNYGEIERKGYRNLVVEKNGVPAVVPNPKWGIEQ